MNAYSLETIATRNFPNSHAEISYQSGGTVPIGKGVDVTLYCMNGTGVPDCAELICGDEVWNVGLIWEGKALCDYDGVFNFPNEVTVMLEELGYDMSYVKDNGL